MKEEGPCGFCGSPATLKCSSCSSVHYCSRDHQKSAWKRHKSQCRPYKKQSSEGLGRHFVCIRDLKPGEIILEEAPLVVGPPRYTIPVCLGCYTEANGDKSCSKCGWPICSDKCQDGAAHLPECTLTRRGRGGKPVTIRDFHQMHPMYACVTLLRCLHLKEADPEKFGMLMTLQAQSQDVQGDMMVTRTIRDYLGLSEYPEELIMKLLGILMVNGQEVPTVTTPVLAVYTEGSIFEHNCVANCAKSFDSQQKLILRSATKVTKCQHLSICYSDPLWGTPNRQQHLQESKFFQCRCQRCADPTELGTFISALKCPAKDKDKGWLLMEDPLNGESDWKCNTCGEVFPSNFPATLLSRAGEELSQLPKGQAEDLEKFVQKYSPHLHPNHQYLLDAKLAMLQLIGTEDVAPKVLELKIATCKQLLDVANIVAPGVTRLRGLLLYELQSSYAMLLKMSQEESPLHPEELRQKLLEVRVFLKEAVDILSLEYPPVEEAYMGQSARKELEHLDVLLQNLPTVPVMAPL